MSRTPSLTGRLIWILTAAATLLWLVAALLAADTLRSRLDAAFDGGLKETAERLLALAVDSFRDDNGEQENPRETHEIPSSDTSGEYIVYQVRDGGGTVLLRSRDAPVEVFDAPLRQGFSSAGPWRVYTVGTEDGGIFIQVAEASAHRFESLWSSVLYLMLPLGLLIPLSALGIFLAVQSGLRPIRQFSARISQLHAANLTPVGDSGLPSELRPMAQAVDELIGRLRTALDAERSFAANSAHELRTPIAGSLAQAQRLIAELDDNPAARRAEQIAASLVRLKDLAEKLLQLSRADAGFGTSGQPIDLLPALRLLVDDLARAPAPSPAVELVTDPGLVLSAPIDIDAFGIVVRNLLDNAKLHGTGGRPIQIAARPGVIEISNDGPLVSAEVLARLSARFVRGRTTAQGSGLGLAIADTIMKQAGGRLDLLSPRPGAVDGFCARLILPVIIP